MLMYLAIGMLAGVLTGVPIGPANVAVIDAAYRHTMRRAMAVSAGAAIADGFCAAGGVLGIGPLLKAYPSVPPILSAISGVVLMIYGFLTARSQPVQPATPPSDNSASDSVIHRREVTTGFKVGVALILLNPAALVTWVLIMGSMIAPPDSASGIACAIGVMVGSFGWFALVAHLTQKGKSVLGEKAAWIPRVVGMMLMVYAVYLIVKAVQYAVA